MLTWDAASNNRFMLNGEGCLTLDTVSIPRASENMKLPIADDLRLAKVPEGPAGRLGPAFGLITSFIWNFAENIEGAKQFLVDYIGHSRAGDSSRADSRTCRAFRTTVPDLATVVADDPVGGSPGKYSSAGGGRQLDDQRRPPRLHQRGDQRDLPSRADPDDVRPSRDRPAHAGGGARPGRQARCDSIFQKWKERGKV